MSFPCIEKTVDIDLMYTKIRLWIGKKDIVEGFKREEEIASMVKTFLNSESHKGFKSLTDFLKGLGDVNAVQVLNKDYLGEDAYGDMVYFVEF